MTFRNPPSAFRLGVTLIELLITITIIATLAAAFLGASRSAMEHANAARTKSTIAKLNGLLMQRWASYATRRVDFNITLQSQLDSMPERTARQRRDKGKIRADARLLARRELMKLEMPDRWSDVLLNGVPDKGVTVSPSLARSPVILKLRPSLSNNYLRRFFQAVAVTVKNNVQENGVILRKNQSAECLYMIIILATDDGEARTLFRQQDIGDTDGDGAPEFLDGWGNPIKFIRWPAGFTSSQIMSRDADADHDPFDYFRRDTPAAITPPPRKYPIAMQASIRSIRNRNQLSVPQSAFRLVPLIYSLGPDGISDILIDTGKVTQLDPYAFIYGLGNDQQLASLNDIANDGDNSLDNIHNHLLDGR